MEAFLSFLLRTLKFHSTFYSLCRLLKIFNEIVLAFSIVDSKANILCVKINFTGNLLLGFCRYRGKALPKTAVFHLFRASALTNSVFSIFFQRLPVVNNCRNKNVFAFWLYFICFETMTFYIFFIKMGYFGSNVFF